MHWTYAKPETSDLSQGDVLLPSTELREKLLRPVHPYFAHQKYLAFMVTTQSCDLVLRGGKPSASHISIAPVRSLKAVWPLTLTKADPFMLKIVDPPHAQLFVRRINAEKRMLVLVGRRRSASTAGQMIEKVIGEARGFWMGALGLEVGVRPVGKHLHGLTQRAVAFPALV